MGAVASVLGVATGVATAWAVGRIVAATDAPIPLRGLTVTPVTVIAGLLVGIAMTMIAASAPGRAATRVSPLAALQPLESKPEPLVVSRARRLLGLLGLVVGVGILAVGVATAQVLIACVGGLLTFVAIVLLSQRIVRP